MAETMVTDPVYLDQTAKDNGRKLDQMTAALLGMSSSLGVIARAQTGVVEEMDYNGIKAVVAAGNAPAVFPVGTQLVNTYTGKDGKAYDCPWDVVKSNDIAEGETGTTAPAMVLQMHYASLEDIQFSAYQAFYVVQESGLAAGTYNVKIGLNWGTNVKNGTSYQFTLTTVPATAAQLDRMTEAYAPLTPALLPYGVKKALTSAAGAAGWSAQEKAAALLQLGADDRFYSKAEADRKFGMGCTLPCATAAVLGGVKVGRGLTVSADGTLEMTAENLDTVLGFSLAEKLNQLRGVTDMNGKLVYTSDGAAGKSNKTMTVPDEVDYIVVRMAVPLECTTIATTGGVAAAAAADYGCTRIVRGGTAVAIVGGGNTYNLRDGVYCKGEALVKVSFAANGTVNIGVVDVNLASNDNAYPFNVEGYQYV